eukprot:scaffold7975_cov267-Pinguiococcus_pyrenoidosus.AAC.1
MRHDYNACCKFACASGKHQRSCLMLPARVCLSFQGVGCCKMTSRSPKRSKEIVRRSSCSSLCIASDGPSLPRGPASTIRGTVGQELLLVGLLNVRRVLLAGCASVLEVVVRAVAHFLRGIARPDFLLADEATRRDDTARPDDRALLNDRSLADHDAIFDDDAMADVAGGERAVRADEAVVSNGHLGGEARVQRLDGADHASFVDVRPAPNDHAVVVSTNDRAVQQGASKVPIHFPDDHRIRRDEDIREDRGKLAVQRHNRAVVCHDFIWKDAKRHRQDKQNTRNQIGVRPQLRDKSPLAFKARTEALAAPHSTQTSEVRVKRKSTQQDRTEKGLPPAYHTPCFV